MRPVNLLLISLLALLSSTLAAAGEVAILDDLIGKAGSAICHHTDYEPICADAVHQYAGSFRVINAESILSMHVRMASSRVQSAKSAALDLQAAASDNMLRETYKICVGLYDDMLQDLDNGLKAAVGHDQATASNSLSAVISYIGTCNDGFAEMQAENPLEKRNNVLKKLASNSIAIAELMG